MIIGLEIKSINGFVDQIKNYQNLKKYDNWNLLHCPLNHTTLTL